MCDLSKQQKQLIIQALLTEINDLRTYIAQLPMSDIHESLSRISQRAIADRRAIIKLLSKREV